MTERRDRNVTMCSMGLVAVTVSGMLLFSNSSFAQQPATDSDPGVPSALRADQDTAAKFLKVLLQNPRTGVALENVCEFYLRERKLNTLIAALMDPEGEAAKQIPLPEASEGAYRMVLGLIQLRTFNADTAAMHLANACQKRPDDPMAHYYLGKALLASGKPFEAVQAWIEANQRATRKSDTLLIAEELLKVSLRREHRLRKDEVRFEIERAFGDDPRVMAKMASLMASEGHLLEALDQFTSLAAETEGQQQIEFACKAAELKMKLNRIDEAVQDLEQLAGRLRPGSWLATKVERRLDAALFRSRGPSALIDYYREKQHEDPNDLNVMKRLGHLLARFGKADEGLAILEDAIQRAPADTDLRIQLAALLVEQKKLTAAAQHYQVLVRQDPTHPDFGLKYGELLLNGSQGTLAQRRSAAAQAWNALAKTRTQDSVIQVNVATRLKSIQRTNEAIQLLTEALTREPESQLLRRELGLCLYNAGQTQAAVDVWEGMTPENDRTAADWIQLAELYEEVRDPERSLERWNSAAKQSLNFQQILRYADRLHEFGQSDDAIEQLKVAKQVARRPDQIQQLLAVRLRLYSMLRTPRTESGSLSRALRERIRELEKRTPVTVSDLEELSIMLLANGSDLEAKAAIQEAVKRQPNDRFVRTIAMETSSRLRLIREAIEHCRHLVSLQTEFEAYDLRRLAKLQVSTWWIDDAIQTCHRLLKRGRRGSGDYLFAAEIAASFGRNTEAQAWLRTAIQLSPKNNKARSLLADTLSTTRPTEAMELRWQAISIEPRLLKQQEMMRRFTQSYWDSYGLDWISNRIQTLGDGPEGHRARAILQATMYEARRQFDKALQTIELHLSYTPYDVPLLQAAVNICEKADESQKLVEYQSRVVALENTAENRSRLLKSLIHSNELVMDEVTATQIVSGAAIEEIRETVRGLTENDGFSAAASIAEAAVKAHPDEWSLKLLLAELLLIERANRVSSANDRDELSRDLEPINRKIVRLCQDICRQPEDFTTTETTVPPLSQRFEDTAGIWQWAYLFTGNIRAIATLQNPAPDTTEDSIWSQSLLEHNATPRVHSVGDIPLERAQVYAWAIQQLATVPLNAESEELPEHFASELDRWYDEHLGSEEGPRRSDQLRYLKLRYLTCRLFRDPVDDGLFAGNAGRVVKSILRDQPDLILQSVDGELYQRSSAEADRSIDVPEPIDPAFLKIIVPYLPQLASEKETLSPLDRAFAARFTARMEHACRRAGQDDLAADCRRLLDNSYSELPDLIDVLFADYVGFAPKAPDNYVSVLPAFRRYQASGASKPQMVDDLIRSVSSMFARGKDAEIQQRLLDLLVVICVEGSGTQQIPAPSPARFQTRAPGRAPLDRRLFPPALYEAVVFYLGELARSGTFGINSSEASEKIIKLARFLDSSRADFSDKENINRRVLAAWLLMSLERETEALAILRQVSEDFPNVPGVAIEHARLLAAMGQHARVLSVLNSIPVFEQPLANEALLMKSNAFFEIGEEALAQAAARDLVERLPTDMNFRVKLLISLRRFGLWREAAFVEGQSPGIASLVDEETQRRVQEKIADGERLEAARLAFDLFRGAGQYSRYKDIAGDLLRQSRVVHEFVEEKQAELADQPDQDLEFDLARFVAEAWASSSALEMLTAENANLPDSIEVELKIADLQRIVRKPEALQTYLDVLKQAPEKLPLVIRPVLKLAVESGRTEELVKALNQAGISKLPEDELRECCVLLIGRRADLTEDDREFLRNLMTRRLSHRRFFWFVSQISVEERRRMPEVGAAIRRLLKLPGTFAYSSPIWQCHGVNSLRTRDSVIDFVFERALVDSATRRELESLLERLNQTRASKAEGRILASLWELYRSRDGAPPEDVAQLVTTLQTAIARVPTIPPRVNGGFARQGNDFLIQVADFLLSSPDFDGRTQVVYAAYHQCRMATDPMAGSLQSQFVPELYDHLIQNNQTQRAHELMLNSHRDSFRRFSGLVGRGSTLVRDNIWIAEELLNLDSPAEALGVCRILQSSEKLMYFSRGSGRASNERRLKKLSRDSLRIMTPSSALSLIERLTNELQTDDFPTLLTAPGALSETWFVNDKPPVPLLLLICRKANEADEGKQVLIRFRDALRSRRKNNTAERALSRKQKVSAAAAEVSISTLIDPDQLPDAVQQFLDLYEPGGFPIAARDQALESFFQPAMEGVAVLVALQDVLEVVTEDDMQQVTSAVCSEVSEQFGYLEACLLAHRFAPKNNRAATFEQQYAASTESINRSHRTLEQDLRLCELIAEEGDIVAAVSLASVALTQSLLDTDPLASFSNHPVRTPLQKNATLQTSVESLLTDLQERLREEHSHHVNDPRTFAALNRMVFEDSYQKAPALYLNNVFRRKKLEGDNCGRDLQILSASRLLVQLAAMLDRLDEVAAQVTGETVEDQILRLQIAVQQKDVAVAQASLEALEKLLLPRVEYQSGILQWTDHTTHLANQVVHAALPVLRDSHFDGTAAATAARRLLRQSLPLLTLDSDMEKRAQSVIKEITNLVQIKTD